MIARARFFLGLCALSVSLTFVVVVVSTAALSDRFIGRESTEGIIVSDLLDSFSEAMDSKPFIGFDGCSSFVALE